MSESVGQLVAGVRSSSGPKVLLGARNGLDLFCRVLGDPRSPGTSVAK